MAFSDLEMKKKTPKKLREKHYADARANIEQKLSSSWDFIEHYVLCVILIPLNRF